VVFPLAIGLEVWTAVFQLTVTLLETAVQFSLEGIVIVSELEVSDEFLLVILRYKLVTSNTKELFARSWRFETEYDSADSVVVKLEVTKFYLRPLVVPS